MPQKSLRVKTRFDATEEVSKTTRKIEKNTRKMNKSIQRGFRKSTKSALGFKSVLKGILAAGAISRGINALGRGVNFVASEFIGFDNAITSAAVKFKDLDRNSADFDKQIKLIGKSARETAASTLFTPKQAAAGMLFMAKAGFTSTEAMGGLISMIRLATATGEDFAQVSDQSSDLLGAFGLSVKDTAQKIKNLNRLNDVLAVTSNTANVTVNDMFQTMKQIGPIATGILGASLEEVAALTAVLGNSGIKGSDAMTALKNAYLRLSAATGPGAAMMKIFNLTLKDGEGGVKKMTDLLQEFIENAKFKALDPVDQAKVMDAIFGKRAIAGSKNLMDNIANIREYEKRALSAGGTTKEVAAIMQNTLEGRIKILGSTLTELGFKVLDPFEKKIKNNITALTEFFKKVDATKLVKSFIDAITTARNLFTVIEPFKFLIPAIVTAWVAWNTVLKIQAGIAAVQMFLAMTRAIQGATIAQTAFNLAMTANPIGLVITAVAGLIALTVTLAMNWESVTNSVGRATAALKKFFGTKDPAAQSAADQRKALDAVSAKQEPVIKRRKFSEQGLLALLVSKINPEFAARRTEELNRPQQPLQPAFAGAQQTQLNVNVENQINAKDIEVDTKVKAPGTSGKIGTNKFD